MTTSSPVAPGKKRIPLPLVPRTGALPLSFMQQRLWFLAQMEGTSATYNVYFFVRLQGALDADALERALQGVVDRHESLRTTFAAVDGQPVQRIAASLDLRLRREDLTGREQDLRAHAEAEARTPFDLEHGPLARATLVRLSQEEHALLFVTHHIVCDAVSLGWMANELSALYAAAVRSEPPRLPELPAQYADFAHWQRQTLTGDVLEAERAWWKERLSGAPPALELPTDRPRPPRQTSRGAVYRLPMPQALATGIRELSRKAAVTPYMTLLAAFQVLLSRYSGQEDLVVGTPVAGRGRREVERLIGFFANTLALRLDTSGDPAFLALLGRVRDVCLGAYAHPDMPFEQLVDLLVPQRDPSRSPLFQAMFVHVNSPWAALKWPGLTVTELDFEPGVARFDITLFLYDDPSGLEARWEYNADLFDEATIARMAAHYARLLEGAVANPGAPVSALPLLTARERERAVKDWNDTGADVAVHPGVHALFEASVRRSPDAIAVRFGEASLTYAELDRRANRVAHALRQRGVTPDTAVGLCVDRSLELAVGVLGILKSGAAYCPLDPAYPPERLALMLETSRAKVLVTRRSLAAGLPEGVAERLFLEDGLSTPDTAPTPAGGPDTLAYVIFTSGSTGVPKGVAMPHRPLFNLIQWQVRRSSAPRGRTLQFSALSFDVCFQEMLPTFAAGGELVLVSEDTRRDGRALLTLMRDQGVERIFLPFVALQHLAEVADSDGLLPTSLQEINTAGEQLRMTPALRRLLHALDGCVLDNHYGPTETHAASAHVLKGNPDAWPDLPPIGRTITNARTYLLDARGEPVPVGVAGELFIGGAGLARGYLHRPDLTAERFLPDPLSPHPGARMYRTGDFARYLPDGTLEFLGRRDAQVKIRGYRIELPEVEAAVAKLPGVKDVAVIAREDAARGKHLVAYVVTQPGADVDAAGLKAVLRDRLPEYMVPAAFVLLDAFPLTPSGKLDRRALPAPDEDADEAQAFVAPRTPLETEVAGVFAALLRLPRVGAHDHFFERGGHSLLATQVTARLRDRLQVELPVRVLFEFPTVEELAAHLASLKPKADGEASPLVPRPRDEVPPLSSAQARLWFLTRMDPDGFSYNLPWFTRWSGPLDDGALEQCLQALVRRHEALRTTFVEHQGQPVQRIAPELHVPLRRERVSSEAELVRRAEAEVRLPFDLAQGPLVRATLVRVRDGEHALLVTFHHIICDGWSLGVVERELTALYREATGGGAAELPPLSLQPADFARWQQRNREGAEVEARLGYWKARLQDAPAFLDLPTDRPRPAVQTFEGAHLSRKASPALSRALEALAQQEGATPFMLLLAGFHALLARYSGQHDVVIGAPLAGRERQELEGLVGFFINTVPLRITASREASFRELVGRVRDRTLEAFAHQDMPFEQLVRSLQPERDPSRAPLFQVMFVLQNAGGPAARALPDVSVAPLDVETGMAKFDLTLFAQPSAEGLDFVWEYNTALFEEATVARMAGHYTGLLAAAVARLEEPVGRLPLLTDEERQRLLFTWNDTHADYPREASLPSLVEEQARARPQAIAVEFEGRQLTYAELDARANQLAHHLRALGVDMGTPVGLCTGRSLEMVVATLAILKAGGAYVPLDPAYPTERLLFMARDTRLPVLLAQPGQEEKLAGLEARVVALEPSWDAFSRESTRAPRVTVPADALAYVMYTSGSTGRPKGVCIPHRGVVRLVKGATYARFGPEEVLLQLAPISFDASTLELWGALLHGAKLVVFPAHAPSLEELAGVLEQQGITTLFLTTALFNQMAMVQPRALARVRQVMTGGEAMSSLAARQVREAGRDVINVYGPTENTTYSTAHSLEGMLDDGRPVPIGRPITNTQAYVLDALGAPVPVGVAGELYLGGEGLAWGYMHQPAQTAERFVPHPFSTTPGARLYRTGDRVRWRPEGVLDFLGRTDSQVKVRGFRIEPGEIESALKDSPGVEDAGVVVREDVPGDKRLVAYVTGARVDTGDLRAQMAARLPAHMVPSAFVKLERLPLTPSGKVDRKALPAPDTRSGPDAYVAPREGWETLVAELWAPLLGVPRVGAHDHFFELGGHSLLATRVVSRLRDVLQRDVPLRLLLESPTVSGFAERLEALRKGDSGPPVPPIVAGGRDKPRPLSFAQQRLWFLARLDPRGSAYNVPFFFHLDGPLDVPALEGALDALIQRHESLRTTFSDAEGHPVQHVAEHRPFTLALESLDGDALLRSRAEAEVKKPFDLERGPLVRATLVRTAPERHTLLLAMHHIVCDFWSIDILVRELKALYTARHQGEALTLPPLPVQYADFAGWQRQVMAGEPLEAQRAWWMQHLEGAPPTLELPTDRPRPPVQTWQGLQLPRPLPASIPAAVQSLARDAGVTPFMLLLAGFHALLARHSGQDDVVIGTPIAGRGQREVENLIGFFTNTLALRVDASGAESFRALLGRVREACLGAYAHQDMPFEQLVDALVPTRDLARSPLFQVMFVFQNGGAPWELPGVRVSALTFEPGMAKFDLTLFVREAPEGWSTLWEYNTALFDEATVARFADHYTRLLEGALAAPDAPLGTLPLLADAERRQLAAWAHQPESFPAVPGIHAFFEATASRTPDAIAVRFGGESLTYGELERRANQLAHHLRGLGVGTDVRVGIHLRRSLELPVAVLGTLKAGGAYVPLDPAYPPERLTAMLQASGAAVLLTSRELREVLGASEARVLELDARAEALAREPGTRPDARGTAQALAYVIFTSGSTGTPKGIAMHHEALVNLLHWQLGDSVAPGARTLQFSALSFDVSFQELFATWAAGGELVLLTDEVRRDASQLLALLEGAGIERFFMPFVALQNLAEVAEREGTFPTRVREIMVAGEQLRMTPAIRRFMKRTGAVLHNHYGPSEAHAVTSLSLKGDPDTWPALPSIGHPLLNVPVYVLDANLQPVPRGVTGELYVGGVQVCRGYLNQPGLTADRFIPDPLGATPGGRLYRTGDWARHLPDGTLEYLGRRDAQLKVRGFRIELGEIEAALAQHPSVRDCVVDARDDGSGQKRLVGWVVAAGGKPLDTGALRSFLQQRLPEYMVPARWVAMERLPLTPSGKVNRKALPAPEAGREPTRAVVGPRTPLELQLVRIWEEVLGVQPIGVHDNFFELGGHSLLTLRVQSAIHARLGRTLPVAALFQNATVEHLASTLRDATPWTPLVALQKGKEGVRPFFCVHAVGGSVIPYAELARALGPEQPFYGLQARGLDGEAPPCESIAEMAALYVRAVREVQPHGPYLLGGWSLGGSVAWDMAHQLRREGETVALLALLDASASLHFGNPDDREAKARLSAHFLEDLLRASGQPLPPNEGLSSSRWREVLEEASRPLFAAEQSLHLLRHAFEVHLNAGWVYVPPPASGPFTSFEAEASRWDHGWAAYAPGGLDAHTVPGDHYSFLKPPHLHVLAARLRDALAKAREP
ncbi:MULTISPECIES: non-ribosomal peptide synthetase [unclassified Corallococcus]|uniref:non-ribosomal peptide synthetase n=1 Tax=unclassified Corallococcus TaxID=2685029 RepID=UPI001A8DB85D|nr:MULTISPECIES: non-ribosomal peptide synthetase [unclassified Corallococcus]MBN9683565.1 amino acid adenylation domain-containing protein [Corallococcus sp. NCSPR001]WAS84923.1 amino acid adenylation domain-containing protein [Corallococcus sp. NCRR]